MFCTSCCCIDKKQQRVFLSSILLSLILLLLTIHFIFSHLFDLMFYYIYITAIAILYTCSMILISYQNISWKILKAILKSMNILLIIIFQLYLLTLEIITYRETNFKELISSIMYVTFTFSFLILDSVHIKSIQLMEVLCIFFIAINFVNIYKVTFGTLNLNEYFVNNNIITLEKRGVQRGVYLNTLTLMLAGFYTLIKDRNMKRLMFLVGPVYRKTGEATMRVRKNHGHDMSYVKRRSNEDKKQMHLDLIKIGNDVIDVQNVVEVDSDASNEEESESLHRWSTIDDPPNSNYYNNCDNNNSSSNENENNETHNKKEENLSSERKTLKKNGSLRNNVLYISHSDIKSLKSQQIQQEYVKYIQCFVVCSAFITIVLKGLQVTLFDDNFVWSTITYTNMFVLYLSFFAALYRNMSVAVVNAKIKALHFWIIIIFQVMLLIIDFSTLPSVRSAFNTAGYFVGTMVIILMDVMEVKKRYFCVALGFLYCIMNIYVIVIHTVTETIDQNTKQVIVLQVSTHVALTKITLRRMVYINSFIMNLKGLIILIQDTKQEKLMFLTKPVFRQSIFDKGINTIRRF